MNKVVRNVPWTPDQFGHARLSAVKPMRCSAFRCVLVNAHKSVTEAPRALGRPILELSGRVGS